jgi:hypothetical protein
MKVVRVLETILRKALPKTFARLYAAARRLGVESLSARFVANFRQRLPELRDDLGGGNDRECNPRIRPSIA